MASRAPVVAVALLLLVAGGFYVSQSPDSSPTGDGRTTVTLVSDGATVATVHVRISDTPHERYVGLSNTESLGEDEGMLFVHRSEGRHTYVMRRMDFPLDIVFADASGTITTIHHAPTPSGDGDLTRYPGRGKYVLEVPMGFTNRTGVTVGDELVLPQTR